ncbi:hypothetical protein W5A_06870 [Imtechella halotolerans K1]|uniref:Uncharacterized protein n=1 Tax=Imtechella halotolerans K1 TaxID=946077 RepID=I0WFV6_9FLAO|nr:hypothetical protein W5A_06870 [Imtechella halotolerans K1]
MAVKGNLSGVSEDGVYRLQSGAQAIQSNGPTVVNLNPGEIKISSSAVGITFSQKPYRCIFNG